MHKPLVMVNGSFGDQISMFDRGLSYGHALFETLRVVNGDIPLLAGHLARLCADAPKLLLPPPKQAQLISQIEQMLSAGVESWCVNKCELNANLKIQLTAGVGGRGYRLPQKLSPQVILQLLPRVFELPVKVKVLLCETRLAISVLAGVKHCNRLEQILAAQELVDGDYFEGIVCDNDGNVVEGISSNLFLLKNGCVFTPIIDTCGVSGVMRAYLMEHSRSFGPVICTHISIEALRNADRIYMVNSNWGVVAVDSLQLEDLVIHYSKQVGSNDFVQLGLQAFAITSSKDIPR